MERLSEEAERLSEEAEPLRRGGALPFLSRKGGNHIRGTPAESGFGFY